jgi:NAD(P)-dependent dehydrogenase (short-subunit alcohol dehydrogenase family)
MSKTVIITGASGNLGKATVEKFVKEGYNIIATVSPGNKLGYYEDHPQVDIHYLNLQDEVGAEAMISESVKKYKSILAALLLAGGYAGGSIEDTTSTHVQKMFSMNFETAYHIARPVFKVMAEQNEGRIIFIGARPAINDSEGKKNIAYGLSKSLIFKLADFMNAEAKDTNVSCSVIVPSTMDTSAKRQAMPKADFSKWVKLEDVAVKMFAIVSDVSNQQESVVKMYGDS